jgi:hypothetical protein
MTDAALQVIIIEGTGNEHQEQIGRLEDVQHPSGHALTWIPTRVQHTVWIYGGPEASNCCHRRANAVMHGGLKNPAAA